MTIDSSPPHLDRFPVGRISVDPIGLSDALTLIETAAQERHSMSVVLANALTVANAGRSSDYSAAMSRVDLVLADGMPIHWIGRCTGSIAAAVERPRGADLFRLGLTRMGPTQTHFFLGSTPAVVRKVEQAAAELSPEFRYAGSYCPPFRDLDEDYLQDCVSRVGATKATVVWVGLGAPKQDFVAVEIARTLHVPVIGIGAAFDFLAGSRPEAPVILRRAGMEWAFRLISEPRRLWKRYLFGNARFIFEVVRQVIVQGPR